MRENKNIIISSCPEWVKYFKIRIVFCISIVKKVGTLCRTCNDLASEMCWCTTERAQVIDNKALSMLGNEISCLLLLLARPAFFCGSPKNPRERTGRAWGGDKRRRNYREITQPEQRQAGQTGGLAKARGTGGRSRESNTPGIKSDRTHRAEADSRKKRGIMGVSLPLPLSPLDRYQPSGCSVTLDPIFLKTVSLSTPRLCHSISVHLAVSLHPQAPNHHYSFTASRVRSTVTVAPWRGFSYPLVSDLRQRFAWSRARLYIALLGSRRACGQGRTSVPVARQMCIVTH